MTKYRILPHVDRYVRLNYRPCCSCVEFSRVFVQFSHHSIYLLVHVSHMCNTRPQPVLAGQSHVTIGRRFIRTLFAAASSPSNRFVRFSQMTKLVRYYKTTSSATAHAARCISYIRHVYPLESNFVRSGSIIISIINKYCKNV